MRSQSQELQLRDYEELEGTLLPTAVLASQPDASAPTEDDEMVPLVTATPVVFSNNNNNNNNNPNPNDYDSEVQEAFSIPLVASSSSTSWEEEERYNNNRNDDEARRRLAMAQEHGRRAARHETTRVMRHNQNIRAYNNQMDLDVDRANQVALQDNLRERQLVTPMIPSSSTPRVDTTTNASTTTATTPQEQTPYFPTSNRGGYQVRDYEVGDYDDAGYSYEVSEYKSDYD